jgi:hypothetical protein
MKKLSVIIISLAVIVGVAVVLPHHDVLASAASQIQSGANTVNDGNSTTIEVQFKNVANILLFVLGAIAVIMIIFGGIRYVTSAGDSSRVKAAKDTILYSVVGLVVAILAYAIVNFVVTNIK